MMTCKRKSSKCHDEYQPNKPYQTNLKTCFPTPLPPAKRRADTSPTHRPGGRGHRFAKGFHLPSPPRPTGPGGRLWAKQTKPFGKPVTGAGRGQWPLYCQGVVAAVAVGGVEGVGAGLGAVEGLEGGEEALPCRRLAGPRGAHQHHSVLQRLDLVQLGRGPLGTTRPPPPSVRKRGGRIDIPDGVIESLEFRKNNPPLQQ